MIDDKTCSKQARAMSEAAFSNTRMQPTLFGPRSCRSPEASFRTVHDRSFRSSSLGNGALASSALDDSMVVIHLKRSEVDQFLYECSIADSNDKVTRDLVCTKSRGRTCCEPANGSRLNSH